MQIYGNVVDVALWSTLSQRSYALYCQNGFGIEHVGWSFVLGDTILIINVFYSAFKETILCLFFQIEEIKELRISFMVIRANKSHWEPEGTVQWGISENN